MNDQDKTKDQLIAELAELRERLAAVEKGPDGASASDDYLAPTNPRWHSLVANTPVFILVLDRDHRIRFINHTNPSTTPGELIGKLPGDFTLPEYLDTAQGAIEQVFDTGEPTSFEAPSYCEDGHIAWYVNHLGPIFDNGEVIAVSVIAEDITAGKQAEQERDRSHAILNATIESLPFHFFALGPDGRYMLVNAVSRNQYPDAIGKKPEEVCPNERDLALWLENNRRAFAGERVEGEVELTVQGEKRHYFNIVTPIRDGKEFYGILGVNVDITERVKAEEALQKAHDELERRVEERTAELTEVNQKLVTTLESITDGFVSFDRQWRYTYVNQAAARFLRKTREELLGKVGWDVFPEASQLKFHTEFNRAVREDETVHFEEFYPEPMNIWYECHCYPSREGLSVFFQDITDQKQSEAALRESEEKCRTLVEACPDAVVMTDLGGRIVFASRQAVELYGGDSAEELCGLESTSFMVHEERQRAKESIANLVHEGVHRNLEYTFLRRDGTRIPGELSSAVVRDATGRPQALMAVARDITERKRAQRALQRERRTLLHMLRASDHERQTISYDIHDGLAQQLAAAIMQFQTYEHLKDHATSKAKTAYDAGVEMVQQAHSEARRLVSGVRPPALDEAGVAVAISHLVHDQREPKGPQIEYHDDVEFDRLPPILENAIYRIAQEAVTNACQHSQSEKVRVALVQEGDLVRLEVQDWGVGFDPESVDENRFGLEGIKERTRLLGGELAIESEPGKGTRIGVVLPIVERE